MRIEEVGGCTIIQGDAIESLRLLDPFGGSGTTGAVAQQNGRQSILLELNPAYVDIAIARVRSAILSE